MRSEHPPLPRPIAYATPTAREPRRWFSLRTTVLAVLVTGLAQIDLLLPFHFRQIFHDFHLKLPGLTQLWLELGEWWNANYGWAVVWPLVIAASIGITLLRPRPTPGNESAKWLLLANLAFLAMNLLFVLTVFAVYQPIITLIDGISSSGGGR